MILKAHGFDFEEDVISFKVPHDVMYNRRWGAGSVDIDIDKISEPVAPNAAEGARLTGDNCEYVARPCSHYDICPVKNKNLHCYANKPCFN
jgi:hypothetical protein